MSCVSCVAVHPPFDSSDITAHVGLVYDLLVNIASGCQLDEELISLLTKLFETLLEVPNYLGISPKKYSEPSLWNENTRFKVRVNLHGVLTKLKLKYCKK